MSTTGAIDPIQFRNALGKFATGVTVVTAKNLEGGYVGTTASSFNSVSLDPPLILWSIDRSARSLVSYEQGEFFAVNVLAADQVSVSNHFARQQEDKFEGVEYSLNAEGIPVLPDCAAVFECKLAATYDGGDHTIILGEVLRFSTAERKELLFHNGAYAVSEYHPAAEDRVELPVNEQTLPFADSYLPFLLCRSFHPVVNKVQEMLKQQKMAEHEYRLLASLLGVSHCTKGQLQSYSQLAELPYEAELKRVIAEGLVVEIAEGLQLSEAGRARIEPVMAVAKVHEADALSGFNVEESLLFKRYLRKMLETLEG